MNMRSLVVLVMAFFIGAVFTGVAAVRPVHAQQQEKAQKPAQTLARLMKPWPVESRDSGGVLLLSDSPEYLAEYGILYSDVIKGDARVLPKDKVALRGTFKGMNRTISAKSAYDQQRDGLVYIPLGDDEYDRYKQGVDATDGSQAVNYGNYGVMYRLELPTMGSQPVQVMLTPLGGVYAGAVRVEEDRQLAKVVHNPTGRLFFGDVTPANLELHLGKNVILTSDFELSHMGSYKPNRNFALQYSPPGASNLPVLVILAPDIYSS